MDAAEIKTRLLTQMAELLRPAGFRRLGQSFSRPTRDVAHLIGLQSSQGSSTHHLRATVNLAVWVPALAEEGARPNIWSSPWRARLGSLTDHPADIWWEASDAATAAAAERDLLGMLRLYGIPALDQIPDLAALLAIWDSGRSPGLTAVERERYLAELRGAV